MDFLLERDANGQLDLVILWGDYKIVDGSTEILQRVQVNLSTYKGECFVDPSAGTDYHNNVYPYSIDDVTPQDTIKAVILATTGVISIDEFSMEMEDETLTVQAKITTEDGEEKLYFQQ